MDDLISTGILEAVEDHDTVIVFTIRDGDTVHRLAGDGGLAETHAAVADLPPGTLVEYGTEGWGDLQFIAPVDD